MRARRLLLPGLALAHLAVAVAVMRAPLSARLPANTAAMVVVAVRDTPVTPETPPAPPVVAIVANVAAPEIEFASDLQLAMAGPCALTDDVETALRQSVAVPAAVVRIPPTARSVSNALLLWDGTWLRADAMGGAAALEPIRQVVRARIMAAAPACREAAMTGPRLLVVPDGASAIVLAFGSGQWRWSQLLA